MYQGQPREGKPQGGAGALLGTISQETVTIFFQPPDLEPPPPPPNTTTSSPAPSVLTGLQAPDSLLPLFLATPPPFKKQSPGAFSSKAMQQHVPLPLSLSQDDDAGPTPGSLHRVVLDYPCDMLPPLRLPVREAQAQCGAEAEGPCPFALWVTLRGLLCPVHGALWPEVLRFVKELGGLPGVHLCDARAQRAHPPKGKGALVRGS